eukprot:Stramenopile-MAST_4_protein_4346
MTRRKTQHIFEIVTKSQYSDPEFDELLLQLKAFEEDVDTLRKKFEPFVQASRQYCSVLEGASLQAWVMSHRLTGNGKQNDVSSVSSIQMATKNLNDAQDQIGDTRRVVSEVYEDEVMVPINAMCDIRIPKIKRLVKDRENLRKDKDSFFRQLKQQEGKSKVNEKKVEETRKKFHAAQTKFETSDNLAKSSITKLLEERPKLALCIAGFLSCYHEFLSRIARNVQDSYEALPQQEAGFFKHSIVAKLDGDDETVIIPPPMYTGMKKGMTKKTKSSAIISTQSTVKDVVSSPVMVSVPETTIPRPKTPPFEEDDEDSDDENSSESVIFKTSSEKTSSRSVKKFFDDTEQQTTSFKSYMVIALYDYVGQDEEELSFQCGESILVLDIDESGWAAGEIVVPNATGTAESRRRGLFPTNYTRK